MVLGQVGIRHLEVGQPLVGQPQHVELLTVRIWTNVNVSASLTRVAVVVMTLKHVGRGGSSRDYMIWSL